MNENDVGDELTRRAAEMLAFAHEPPNHVDVAAANWRPDERRQHSVQLPGWDTRLTFTYSIEIKPADAGSPKPYRVRHLSIGLTVPGVIPRGRMAVGPETVIALFGPMVGLFFPDEPMLLTALHAGTAYRVNGADHAVTYRTHVGAHFVAAYVPAAVANETPPA